MSQGRDLFLFPPFVAPFGWSWTADSLRIQGTIQFITAKFLSCRSGRDGTPGTPVNITRHADDDRFAGWSHDGKSLYFLTTRDFAQGLESYSWWNSGYELYTTPLRNFPAPRSDVLQFPGDKPSEMQTSGVQIDFDRIWERATAVSPTRGGGNYAALSPDCNTYVYDSNATGSTALWMVPSSGGAATKIADAGGISDIEWFPDNRGVIYLASDV